MAGYFLLALVLQAAAAVDAQKTATAQPKADASAWQVDQAASRVYVKVSGSGLGHSHAVEGRLKSAALGPGAAKDAGKLVFDMGTFAADTAQARASLGMKGAFSDSDQEEITETMRGAKVLDVKRFPEATLTLDSMLVRETKAKAKEKEYELQGRLKLHGVERPVRFTAKMEPPAKPKGNWRLRGQFSLSQREYGIRPYSALFGTIKVADRLEISGDLVLSPPSQDAPTASQTKEKQK